MNLCDAEMALLLLMLRKCRPPQSRQWLQGEGAPSLLRTGQAHPWPAGAWRPEAEGPFPSEPHRREEGEV